MGGPSSHPVQTKFLDWRKPEVTVTVRGILGKELVGTVQVGKSAAKQELFKIPAEATASWKSFYFGFSGWSGTSTYVEVDMSRVEMRNLDKKSIGEDQKDALMGDTDNWEKRVSSL